MLTTIFCQLDDYFKSFHKRFSKHYLGGDPQGRGRKPTLNPSEVMTILVYFQLSGYRHFKAFYTEHILKERRQEFPCLVSYNRFVELKKSVIHLLFAYLQEKGTGNPTGISFIDSTKLRVCHNRRIPSHKVFQNIAERGKDTTGWFYGFKLHLVVSERGEILRFALTPGNVDDRNPKVIEPLTRKLFGKLFGDKGYLSKKLFRTLFDKGIVLITKIKRNMKNSLMALEDKFLLRKRALIETINDELKNVCQVEHSRHRSTTNFVVNLLAALTAYSFKPKKPSLKWTI